MNRFLARLLGALAIVGLLTGPLGVGYAQETLPASAMLRAEAGHIESAEPEGVFMLRLEHKL